MSGEDAGCRCRAFAGDVDEFEGGGGGEGGEGFCGGEGIVVGDFEVFSVTLC